MDKDSLKYMRSFKKAIVRRKSSEGAIVKYLLDFGKRRFIPDTVVKHGSKVEESSNERKKYWVEESYVPLFLLKAFEDKRIALKSNKMSSSKLTFPFSGRVFNSPKKDVFSYLFSKAEQSNTLPCGYCNIAIRYYKYDYIYLFFIIEYFFHFLSPCFFFVMQRCSKLPTL